MIIFVSNIFNYSLFSKYSELFKYTIMKKFLFTLVALILSLSVFSQKYPYDGLDNNIGNLFRLSNSKTDRKSVV